MRTKTLSDKYPDLRIFEDSAQAFENETEWGTLCFGTHLWTNEDVKEQHCICKEPLIAMQSELLVDESLPFCKEEYMQRLRLFDEVWEYSEHNMHHLKEHGIKNVRYVPILPSEALREPPVEKDIDVLHIGTITRRRASMLNCALSQGFRVVDVLTDIGNARFGANLHMLIRRSRVVLGIHTYWKAQIQESFRYQYPLSNDVPVVAEKSWSNPLGLKEFSTDEEMLDLLSEYVTARAPQPPRYTAKFNSYTYMNDALDYRGTRDISLALRFLEEDSEVAIASRDIGLAQRVYKGVKELYRFGADKGMLRSIYNRLPRRNLMNDVRTAIPLLGWPIFRANEERRMSKVSVFHKKSVE